MTAYYVTLFPRCECSTFSSSYTYHAHIKGSDILDVLDYDNGGSYKEQRFNDRDEAAACFEEMKKECRSRWGAGYGRDLVFADVLRFEQVELDEDGEFEGADYIDVYCADCPADYRQYPEAVEMVLKYGIDLIANYMDDEIRERLHFEGIDDDFEFVGKYIEAHREKFGEDFVIN